MKNNDYTHKVVVLGLYDTGVATVRALGRRGILVDGYDYDTSMPGFRSRFCKAQVCKNPTTEPDAVLQMLLQNADSDRQDIILPTSDEFVLFITRHREALSGFYKFLLPESTLLEKILDKAKQYELIAGVGIDVPATFLVQQIEEVAAFLDRLRYPVFIKPVYGHQWRQRFSKDKGLKVYSSEELVESCKEILGYDLTVVVQEIIPGPVTNNYEVSVYVDRHGDIRAEFVVQKIRQYPNELGFATMTVSTHNEEVESLCLSMLKALNWLGFANIEFKLDNDDKKYKFIEINARVWQQVSQPEVVGMNFPLMYYHDLLDLELPAQRNYPTGVKWIDLKSDIVSSIKMAKTKDISLSSWISSLYGVREMGLFAVDDIVPFLHSLNYGADILKVPKLFYKILRKR
ncbi:MAG: hypothetical protein HQL06_05265 [Nitrospirae bacterium]|nr:hypothetical protein [Nitrospirota bacterium]